MLVLSSKVGETVVINNNINVTVESIRGNQVRLSFDAPREIPINRKKIQDQIVEQKSK